MITAKADHDGSDDTAGGIRDSGAGPHTYLFQQVRAEAGFAYGVIGADIHVFGNGTPVYLLFAHRGPAEADPRWMRAQPSRMLDARAEVVEFTGREAELGDLTAWRDAEPMISVRLLHGEGGQGKTRLAARFAADSERAGWKVVHAVHGTDAHPPAPGSQDLRLDSSKGVLLIVDYADRWPLTDLSWLFKNALLRQSVQARVLLVGRSAIGWPAICGRLDQHRENIDTSDQLLTPLSDDSHDRLRMFTVARDSFARHYPEIPEPSQIEPPAPLDRPDYGLTLAVHMAALVAVDATARGCIKPTDMLGLTTYLLNREHENWRQLAENSASGLGYQTLDTVMARVVFVAVLCGPLDRTGAAALLGRLLPDPNPEAIVTDHAVCYPPAEAASALSPMLPDRLAEDFLALMIPGHAVTGFVPDQWSTEVPKALLTNRGTAGHSPRAVTFLAAAADRWPHVGRNVLFPLLGEQPDITLRSGSGGLTKVAAIGSDHDQIDPGLLAVLEAVEPLLPEESHVDLNIGILAVIERLTAHRLPATTDPAEQAWLHARLGYRRGSAGEWALSLEADAEAARLNRQLAEQDPAYRPHLAMSLRNLGNALARMGRWSEALACGRESVALYRTVAAADPARSSQLAGALSSLGSRLRELGLDDEALKITEEAVTLWRASADADPAHLSDLAGALSNFGLELDKAGRSAEALATAEEVERLNRRLAGNNPAEHLPRLAIALVNLGFNLARQDRHAEALTATEEAVRTFRRLAEVTPAAYTPDLVISLLNRSGLLAVLKLGDECLAPAGEAVALARALAAADFDIHRVTLAGSLCALSDRLAELGRKEESLPILREACDLYATLADASRSHEPTRYLLTHKLADIYRETGDRQNEAEMLLNLTGGSHVTTSVERIDVRGVNIDAARRASDLYRMMNNPRYQAAALFNLSIGLLNAGKDIEAMEAIEQAMALYQDIGDSYLEAAAAVNLSAVLLEAGEFDKAIAASERACAFYLELGEHRRLGTPHFNLGKALLSAGRVEESIAAFQAAAEAYREADRGPYEDSGSPSHEADALSSLGEALTMMQRLPEAVIASERAVALYHLTGRANKEREELLKLSVSMLQTERFADAVAVCERAVALCREVGDRPGEGAALNNLAVTLTTLGGAEASLESFAQAAVCLAEVGDHQQAARALHGLAVGCLGLDRFEEAAAAFRRELESHRKAGSRRGECDALRGLAACHLKSGELNEALTTVRLALEIYEEEGDRAGQALTLDIRVAVLRTLGHLEKAINAGWKAADAWRSANDAAGEASALSTLGASLGEAARYEESATVSRRAAALHQQLGDRRQEARALDNLGRAFWQLGRNDEAVTACRESVTIFRELGDPSGEAKALFHFGSVLADKGRLDQALDVTRRAVGLADGAENLLSEEGTTLYSLGEALRAVGRLPEAIAANRRCADVFRGLGNAVCEGSALLNLCVALYQSKRFDELIPAAQRAAAVYHKIGDQMQGRKARLLEGLGLLAQGRAFLARNDFAKAADASRQAASIFAALGDLAHQKTALWNQYSSLVTLRKPLEAIPVIQQHAELAGATGDNAGIAVSLLVLGGALAEVGHLTDSATASQQAMEIFLELGDREAADRALRNHDMALKDRRRLRDD